MGNEREVDGVKAKTLREYRDARALDQAEMAALLGVPVGSYRNWEQGAHAPYPKTRRQIAAALGVAPDAIRYLHQPRRRPAAR